MYNEKEKTTDNVYTSLSERNKKNATHIHRLLHSLYEEESEMPYRGNY